MKKIFLVMKNNTEQEVDVVRYFAFKDSKYLIYTMGEFDENNYQTLYVVKEMQELGSPILQTIRDDQEWADLKQDIRQIIKEIKKGAIRSFQDLDVEEVNGLYVADARVFKLARPIVEILENNEESPVENVATPVADPVVSEQPIALEPIAEEVTPVPTVDNVEEEVTPSAENPVIEEITPAPVPEMNDVAEETKVEEPIEETDFAASPEITPLPNLEEPENVEEIQEVDVPVEDPNQIFNEEPISTVEEPIVESAPDTSNYIPTEFEDQPILNNSNDDSTVEVEGVYQTLKEQIEIQERRFMTLNEENKTMKEEINNLQKINEELSQNVEQLKSEIERYQVKWSEIKKLVD